MKTDPTGTIEVYLETGKKRTFASALDWPGWSRSGSDELSALQALLDYSERYSLALKPAGLEFHIPMDISAFSIVEKLGGDATTDFGAPSIIPVQDKKPMDESELRRLQSIMTASWAALDHAAKAASGKELRKGPRGGGRDLERIIRHVLESTNGYLSKIGGRFKLAEDESLQGALNRIQNVTYEFLGQSARGELPSQGPRGGIFWPPRYFARRAAWHVLDHAWEIEDRAN